MSASVKPKKNNGVFTSTLDDFFAELATGKYNEIFKASEEQFQAKRKAALENPEKYAAEWQAKVRKFREELAKDPEGREALKSLGYPTLH